MIEKVSIVVDNEIKSKIEDHYKDLKKPNSGTYIAFFAKNDDLEVTIFSNKKGQTFKVFFLGENALKEAKQFNDNATLLETKQTTAPKKACWEVFDDQVGSDEVGTGDFFGPICVCAAYVGKKDIKRLKELGVDDSKRLNDKDIERIGKILIKEFDYSQLSLDNEKYNELIDKNLNMNEMKVKMHNRCLFNVLNKHKKAKHILVDQFTTEKNYYKYLKNEKEVVDGITFKTKGESYFPSVAVGSIIARYSFIQHMEKLSKKYGMKIPYGANTNVTKFAKEFVNKFGIEELNKIIKKNFANYKEVSEVNLEL